MEEIGRLIVIAIALLVGYSLLVEYCSKKEVRLVYHLFIDAAIVLCVIAMCTNGCED